MDGAISSPSSCQGLWWEGLKAGKTKGLSQVLQPSSGWRPEDLLGDTEVVFCSSESVSCQRTATNLDDDDPCVAGPCLFDSGDPPHWPTRPGLHPVSSSWSCLQDPVGLTSLWGSPAAEKMGIF